MSSSETYPLPNLRVRFPLPKYGEELDEGSGAETELSHPVVSPSPSLKPDSSNSASALSLRITVKRTSN